MRREKDPKATDALLVFGWALISSTLHFCEKNKKIVNHEITAQKKVHEGTVMVWPQKRKGLRS